MRIFFICTRNVILNNLIKYIWIEFDENVYRRDEIMYIKFIPMFKPPLYQLINKKSVDH